MYQKITIVGRISEPSKSDSGKMLRFGVAVQERKDDPTEWFNARIINSKMLSTLEPMLAKGRLVLIEGRQSTSENEGKRYTNLIVDRLRLLESREQAEKADASSGSSGSSGSSNSAPEFLDSDVPF